MEQFETLEYLREALFCETLYRYQKLHKVIGSGFDTYSREYEEAFAKYSVLYELLEDTGFEDQYQEWKREVLAEIDVLPAGERSIKDVDWEAIRNAIETRERKRKDVEENV